MNILARATDREPRFAPADGELAREVHRVVRDLMPHRIGIYWTDFLITWTVAMAGLALGLGTAGWRSAAGIAAAALALYRASIFTHEIAHMRRGRYPAFRAAWNLMVGVPCLMPSFLYEDHRSHHVSHSYGTRNDAEYYPLAHGPARVVVVYFLQVFVLPIAAVVRFLVLAPLSLLFPPLRRFVWQRCSSLAVINPSYRRPRAKRADRPRAWMQECGCFLWLASLAGAFAAGAIPLVWLAKLYAVFLIGASVNYVRALAAHRYLNRGEPVSYVGQLLDSTTIEGGPVVTELIAPLGMRYHALHHLVPSLPYHSMGEAHRRLMRELPPESPYRATLTPGIAAAVADVCRNAWRGGPETTEVATAGR